MAKETEQLSRRAFLMERKDDHVEQPDKSVSDHIIKGIERHAAMEMDTSPQGVADLVRSEMQRERNRQPMEQSAEQIHEEFRDLADDDEVDPDDRVLWTQYNIPEWEEVPVDFINQLQAQEPDPQSGEGDINDDKEETDDAVISNNTSP